MSIKPFLKLGPLLTAWLLLLASSALAASPLVEVKDLKQAVSPDSPATYLDLLKLVHPGLEAAGGPSASATAGQSAAVRHLDGDYEERRLTGDLEFTVSSALPLKAQGRPLLIINVSVNSPGEEEPGGARIREYNLLALCQTRPAPGLLDLVDIRQPDIIGQSSGFWTDNPLINLTPATQACMIYQEHFNAQQSYNAIRLLFVRDRRLEEVLGVSPFGERARCSTFATKAVFWTEPDRGRDYPRVVAKLTLTMEPGEEDCNPPEPGFTRSYQGVWQWDPAGKKYRQVSGNLDRLYKFYEKYY